jgi:hypothetical protein
LSFCGHLQVPEDEYGLMLQRNLGYLARISIWLETTNIAIAFDPCGILAENLGCDSAV